METLRIRAGSEELKVEGSQELIERERKAFYEHLSDIEARSVKAREMVMNRLRADSSVMASLSAKKAKALTRKTGLLDTHDWRKIAEAIKGGEEFHVGDMVKDSTVDGCDFTMVVTDVTDEYVRFESKDCVGEKVYWNRDLGNGNKGGFPQSAICGYLENELWESLPEDLKEVISETTRMYKDSDGEGAHSYKTKLFLPAASEVFDEDDCYGDEGLYEQLDYYKDRRNRTRGSAEGEDACYWWLASVGSGDSTSACNVNTNGDAYDNGTTTDLRVPLCFLIKKS